MPPVRNVSVAPVLPRRAAEPAAAPAGPATVRIDKLLEKLPTEQGVALADQLLARIAPNLKDEGLFEPYVPLKHPPTNTLDLALMTGLQRRFANAGDARKAMPGLLADMLLPYLRHGDLDIGQAEKALGKDLGDWLRKLAAIPDDAPTRPTADRIVYDQLSSDERARVLGEAPTIAPPMEAINFTLKNFSKPGELEGFQFLGLQHLFASSEAMFRSLDSLGVDPKDTRLIGKIYSTNMRVVGELQTLGTTVDGVSTNLHSKKFATAMEESIYRQLSEIVGKLPKPISRGRGDDGKVHLQWAEPPRPRALLIDDGAEAIKMLHERFPEYAPFFACVEQTRRGARIAHQLADAGELKCAVVNVAESWAKLERESPMIGESVVREVERKLDHFEHAGVPRPKEATVIGYGAVGKRVASALMARGMTVHVYDSNPEVLKNLPPGLVGDTDKAEALKHGQVTVSCVGARTLWQDDWKALPNGAVLVNAASADDELGPEDLLRYNKGHTAFDTHGDLWGVFQQKAIDLGQSDDPAHSDSIVRLDDGKELLVASNGFVVNMTGERDPIPPRYIQLTRALLLMGAITATRATKPGLIDVPQDWQDALVAHVEHELGKTGGSLQKPLWDAVVDAPVGPPPDAIVDRVHYERTGKADEEEQRLEGKIVGEEQAGLIRGKTPPPPSLTKVHGYPLGKATDRESFAWTVATQMGVPEKDMGSEAWALYHATRFANGALGWHLRVRFNPDEPGRLTADQLLACPANQARRAAAPKEAEFDAFFGYHLFGLTYGTLKAHLKREPTPDEIAGAMVRAARDGKTSLQAYADYLRTQSPDDVALADALKKAGAP